MLRIATLANLIAYSIVVSQPLAYAVFLGRVQQTLSPPAYVELRQRINPTMAARVPTIYVGTLLTLLSMIGLALREGASLTLATSVIALVCLLIDVLFMVRKNLPINRIVDQWSTTDIPADWARHRDAWFAAFGSRAIALFIGFLSALVGAVFRF